MNETPTDDPTLWTTIDQAAAIARGDLSSRALTEAVIERIRSVDPVVNAVATTDFDHALASADEADRAVAEGRQLGPLHGVPITVKDALETDGLRSTGGALDLADNVPDRDAPVVAAVRSAGAIVIGKTNLPNWSGDIQAFNPIFGTTVNPWDATRVPAGSSGGAAAAVATGMTSFEIGTDIGGSIRFPAAFNGIYGHKPTYGIVPSTGYLDHAAAGDVEADVNVIGPLARSAEDLDLLLSIMLRTEGPLLPQLADPPGDLRSLRIAAWLDDPFCPVDSACLASLETAVAALEADGYDVDRSARPDIDPAEASELGLALVGAAIDYEGRRPDNDHATWLQRHTRRNQIRARWRTFFERFDVVLMPVSFVPPFEHRQEGNFATRTLVCNGEQRPYADVVKWTLLTGMAYLPASVPPIDQTPDGLPVGVQIVGAEGSDRTTIALAGALGRLVGGYRTPPVALGESSRCNLEIVEQLRAAGQIMPATYAGSGSAERGKL